MATYKTAPKIGKPPPAYTLTKRAQKQRRRDDAEEAAQRAARLDRIDVAAVLAADTPERRPLRNAPRLQRDQLPPSIARTWAKLERHGRVGALGILGSVVVIAVQLEDGRRCRIFYRWVGEASILRADGAVFAGRALTLTAALAELEAATS